MLIPKTIHLRFHTAAARSMNAESLLVSMTFPFVFSWLAYCHIKTG